MAPIRADKLKAFLAQLETDGALFAQFQADPAAAMTAQALNEDEQELILSGSPAEIRNALADEQVILFFRFFASA